MTLIEVNDSKSKMGPLHLERQLHVERVQGGWYFKITGPRGGRMQDAQFGYVALKEFLRRLLADL